MSHIQFRPRKANHQDIPFLLELRRMTINVHQIASGLIPSEEEHLDRIHFRFDCARIIVIASQSAGLLKVSCDNLVWKLIQIQIIPSLQGQGLRRQIIQSVITQAKHVGATLNLSVLKANPVFRLYELLGFTIIEKNKNGFEMQLGPFNH